MKKALLLLALLCTAAVFTACDDEDPADYLTIDDTDIHAIIAKGDSLVSTSQALMSAKLEKSENAKANFSVSALSTHQFRIRVLDANSKPLSGAAVKIITATKRLEIIFLTLFIASPPIKIHPKEIIRWVEIQHINLISFPTT